MERVVVEPTDSRSQCIAEESRISVSSAQIVRLEKLYI